MEEGHALRELVAREEAVHLRGEALLRGERSAAGAVEERVVRHRRPEEVAEARRELVRRQRRDAPVLRDRVDPELPVIEERRRLQERSDEEARGVLEVVFEVVPRGRVERHEAEDLVRRERATEGATAEARHEGARARLVSLCLRVAAEERVEPGHGARGKRLGRVAERVGGVVGEERRLGEAVRPGGVRSQADDDGRVGQQVTDRARVLDRREAAESKRAGGHRVRVRSALAEPPAPVVARAGARLRAGGAAATVADRPDARRAGERQDESDGGDRCASARVRLSCRLREGRGRLGHDQRGESSHGESLRCRATEPAAGARAWWVVRWVRHQVGSRRRVGPWENRTREVTKWLENRGDPGV